MTSNKSDPSYIHQCCIDVIAGFSINRNEERQASVHRQDVHAAVLIVVTWEQTYAAVLRTDTRCHYIQSLKKKTRRTVTYTFKTLGCSWSHLGGGVAFKNQFRSHCWSNHKQCKYFSKLKVSHYLCIRQTEEQRCWGRERDRQWKMAYKRERCSTR